MRPGAECLSARCSRRVAQPVRRHHPLSAESHSASDAWASTCNSLGRGAFGVATATGSFFRLQTPETTSRAAAVAHNVLSAAECHGAGFASSHAAGHSSWGRSHGWLLLHPGSRTVVEGPITFGAPVCGQTDRVGCVAIPGATRMAPEPPAAVFKPSNCSAPNPVGCMRLPVARLRRGDKPLQAAHSAISFSTRSSFTGGSACTRSIVMGDVDGDGDLDLEVGNHNCQANELLVNNGYTCEAAFRGETKILVRIRMIKATFFQPGAPRITGGQRDIEHHQADLTTQDAFASSPLIPSPPRPTLPSPSLPPLQPVPPSSPPPLQPPPSSRPPPPPTPSSPLCIFSSACMVLNLLLLACSGLHRRGSVRQEALSSALLLLVLLQGATWVVPAVKAATVETERGENAQLGADEAQRGAEAQHKYGLLANHFSHESATHVKTPPHSMTQVPISLPPPPPASMPPRAPSSERLPNKSAESMDGNVRLRDAMASSFQQKLDASANQASERAASHATQSMMVPPASTPKIPIFILPPSPFCTATCELRHDVLGLDCTWLASFCPLLWLGWQRRSTDIRRSTGIRNQTSRLANRQCTITGAFCAPKRRLLVVLLYFGSATASQSRLQVRTPFSQSAPPPMPSSLEQLSLPLWRVEGASPPPVRAPPLLWEATGP